MAPHRESLINTLAIRFLFKGLYRLIIRNTPYPPSFSRIAARTIDPAIGASTWAFGSHKWTENIGNFTKKPRIIINHR